MTFSMTASRRSLVRNLLAVLRGDDHGVDARRAAVNVFDGDLGFAVRTEEIDYVLLADLGELVGELVSQLDRHGHQFGSFVAGDSRTSCPGRPRRRCRRPWRYRAIAASRRKGRRRFRRRSRTWRGCSQCRGPPGGRSLVFEDAAYAFLMVISPAMTTRPVVTQRLAAHAAHGVVVERCRERHRRSGRQSYRDAPRLQIPR